MAYGPTRQSRPAGLYKPCPLLEWNEMHSRRSRHWQQNKITLTSLKQKLTGCSRYDTISDSGRLAIPSCNREYCLCKYYFANTVDNTWNSVPSYTVSANVVNVSKADLTNIVKPTMSNQYIIYDLCAEIQRTVSQTEVTLITVSLTRSSAVTKMPRGALCPEKFAVTQIYAVE